jgi:hypothetical protein
MNFVLLSFLQPPFTTSLSIIIIIIIIGKTVFLSRSLP